MKVLILTIFISFTPAEYDPGDSSCELPEPAYWDGVYYPDDENQIQTDKTEA
jgi:hypothetical protein